MQDGAPLLIKAKTARSISAIGKTTLLLAAVSTFITAMLVMGVIWVVLTRLIVAPLNKLTNHVVDVGKTGDLSKRMALERNDEIGVLAKEFDAATEQLGNVRRRLVEDSYQSGMAEIAAGVIHNVRNALSPVVVTVSHLSEVAVMPPATHLDTAFKDLKSEKTDPERRFMLVEYVEAAMKAMLERGQRFAEDLRIVAEQNRHIEQILQDHSALSMDKRRFEPVQLSAVIQDAQRLLPANGSAIVDVRVADTIHQMPAIHGHPIVIAQILGNLMVNAAEAIQETGRVSGRIDIHAELELENGRECVHLEVKDNGNGIDPEVLKNLFGRGFSTKKAKTGGIGLHWSANSIATMGGRMYAKSKGVGRGATFHLILPVSGTPAVSRRFRNPDRVPPEKARPHDQHACPRRRRQLPHPGGRRRAGRARCLPHRHRRHQSAVRPPQHHRGPRSQAVRREAAVCARRRPFHRSSAGAARTRSKPFGSRTQPANRFRWCSSMCACRPASTASKPPPASARSIPKSTSSS